MTIANTSRDAMKIAKDFLEEAGFPIIIITKVSEIDDKWYIEATAFSMNVSLNIDKKTGEISDYEAI